MEEKHFHSSPTEIIKIVIEDIIPKEEVEFIKAINEWLIIPQDIPDNPQYFLVKLAKELQDKLPIMAIKYPFFSTDKYTNLFITFYRSLIIKILNENDLDSAFKIEGCSEMIDAFHNISHAFPDINVLELASDDIKFFEREIKKSQSLIDRGITKVPNKTVNTLFDINLDLLEDQLIKERLIQKSNIPLSSLLNSKWVAPEKKINWEGNQSSLLYLFYLINKNRRDIINGTITILISKFFTIKNKELDERKLSKSLTKLIKTYIDDTNWKGEQLLQIDRILYKINS